MDNYLEDMEFLTDCGVILAGIAVANELGLMKNRRVRQHRVNPYNAKRNTKDRFMRDFENLKNSPKLFLENFRMPPEMFEELFLLTEPLLRRKRNDFIPERAKLAIVLEYMCSGDLQRHISYYYRLSKEHLSKMIINVCKAICHVLRDQIPQWNKQTLAEVGRGFREKWDFPNCVGAIYARSIHIMPPPSSRSTFQNDKGLNSITLLAVCDADYRFTHIDVGVYENDNESGNYFNSKFVRSVIKTTCLYPADSFIGSRKLPHYLVGDETFHQSKRIMKAFNKKDLTGEEKIFNYRFNRARRCIENAFGILSIRWACLQKVLLYLPENAKIVITACCLLHNWLITNSRTTYCPEEFSGSEKQGVWIKGDWEMQGPSKPLHDLPSLTSARGRTSDYSKHVRNILKEYVNSPDGSFRWQNKAAIQ